MPVETFTGMSADGRFEIKITRHADVNDSIQDIILAHQIGEPIPGEDIARIVQTVEDSMDQLAEHLANTVSLAFIFALSLGPGALDLTTKRLSQLIQELATGNWPEESQPTDHPYAGWAGVD